MIFALASRNALLYLAAGLFFTACESDTATKSETDQPSQNPKKAIVAAKPAPLNVSVFLEYSGGMKGFMPLQTAANPSTEFQQRVGDLFTDTYANSAVAQRQFFLCLEDSISKPVKYQQMMAYVQGEKPKEAALGTELPDLLNAVLARPAASREVSVVVSDFIYGPKNGAPLSQIKNRIRIALVEASKAGLAIAVYAETSRFYGTFHPAVKAPKASRQLGGERLPYYIWVVGPPALVARYTRAALTRPTAQYAGFGLSLGKVPAVAVLTGLPAKSALLPTAGVSCDGMNGAACQNLDVDLDGGAPAEFTVALNISALSPAWQQPAFLAAQLHLQVAAGTTAAIVPGSLRAVAQAAGPLAGYTHTVRVRLSAVASGSTALRFVLPAPDALPGWVGQWSTENDNQPAPRTYRLTEVLAGVRASYPAALPPVFTAVLTLNKE
ncbi:hypothetical protein [Hymenobacter siberiensis]|uniref:hypothetical protein n=1 Tax=Hymenobacter siberiensis TaxID=2848396 RepID=UPI001C1E85A4|nr:hypothetical protein [Hymenobacter siberiensis]MBU6120722.1 hypothetical protein [Hymenobacter siberiensis]